MLYAHRNTASDNRVRCERNVQQKEGSKNAGFPKFILWISRQKVYCLIELELTLNLQVTFLCFLGFGYKITDKPRIPSDNFDPASSRGRFTFTGVITLSGLCSKSVFGLFHVQSFRYQTETMCPSALLSECLFIAKLSYIENSTEGIRIFRKRFIR